MERDLIYGEVVEMDEEESARFTEIERQADLDAEREIREHRVSLHWTTDQARLIREVAAMYGLTYQAYLKPAIMRQAMGDLKAARKSGSELLSRGERSG